MERKGFLRLVLVALLLIGTTVALTAGGAPEKITIDFWERGSGSDEFQTEMMKKFMAANPGITVNYVNQVRETYDQTLILAKQTDKLPDIYIPPLGTEWNKIELGWAAVLNDIAPSKAEFDAWMKHFPADSRPFLEGMNMYDGKVITFPMTGGEPDQMLFWNKKLFKAAGLNHPPRNWVELREYAKKITAQGGGKVYGIVEGAKGDAWDVGVQRGLMVPSGWWNEWYRKPKDGRDKPYSNYTDPIVKGAIQLILDMRDDGSYFPGTISMNRDQALNAFALEQAAMFFGGAGAIKTILATNPKIDFDLTLPIPKDGKFKIYWAQGPRAGNLNWVVNPKTKNPKAVWKLVTFLTSVDYHKAWVKAGGQISVFPEANAGIEIPQLKRAAELGVYRRTVWGPGGGRWNDAAGKAWDYWKGFKPSFMETITNIWLGKENIDDALRALQERAMAAFDKMIADATAAGVKVSGSDFFLEGSDDVNQALPAPAGMEELAPVPLYKD